MSLCDEYTQLEIKFTCDECKQTKPGAIIFASIVGGVFGSAMAVQETIGFMLFGAGPSVYPVCDACVPARIAGAPIDEEDTL